MDPTSSGAVTFDMFKNWLVDSKDGRVWSDFLVLPEGAVAAMRWSAIDRNLLPLMGAQDMTAAHAGAGQHSAMRIGEGCWPPRAWRSAVCCVFVMLAINMFTGAGGDNGIDHNKK
eukprot:COSAG01_NODE_246_length_20450_cov_195.166822_20_plen_115_part_00